MKRPFILLLAAAGLGGLLFWLVVPSPLPPEDGPPPVLLLVVDALRADRLSANGYTRPTTPHIDALARDGIRFEQAIAPGTFTKTSIASLLTSRHPHQHGVYWGSRKDRKGAIVSDVLAANEITLAEILRDHGYATGAWVHNVHLERPSGLGQGFDRYDDDPGRIREAIDRFRWWVRWNPRFFAFLHVLELHDPYLPKPPFEGRFGGSRDAYTGIDIRQWGSFLRDVRSGARRIAPDRVRAFSDLYDEQLTSVDAAIGELLAWLRATGIYDAALVVLTSDHGDGFLEHGFLSHSNPPWEELIRVPLVVKLPGNRHAGTVVRKQVRLVDVLPTVLEVAGAPPHAAAEGTSLLALVDPDHPRANDFPSIAVSQFARNARASVWVAVRDGRFKLLRESDGPGALYDLEGDPGETTDVSGDHPDEARRLGRIADAVLTAARTVRAPGRTVGTAREVGTLRALGYLAGDEASGLLAGEPTP